MSDTYRLHYYPGNANLAPHVALEEIGAAYELARVDREHGAHRREAYLALNPNGRIPVLEHGTLVLYEAAAVCLHLADAHPQAGLLPPLASHARAHAYKWLAWLTNTLQAEMLVYHYPHRHVADETLAGPVKARAAQRLGEQFDLLDAALAGRTTLVETGYTIADAYLLMVARWGRMLDRPPADYASLAVALDATLARPAVRRAFESEGLPPSWRE